MATETNTKVDQNEGKVEKDEKDERDPRYVLWKDVTWTPEHTLKLIGVFILTAALTGGAYAYTEYAKNTGYKNCITFDCDLKLTLVSEVPYVLNATAADRPTKTIRCETEACVEAQQQLFGDPVCSETRYGHKYIGFGNCAYNDKAAGVTGPQWILIVYLWCLAAFPLATWDKIVFGHSVFFCGPPLYVMHEQAEQRRLQQLEAGRQASVEGERQSSTRERSMSLEEGQDASDRRDEYATDRRDEDAYQCAASAAAYGDEASDCV